MAYTTWTFCKGPGCMARHKADRWSNSRADADGWFHQKGGDAWCPLHNPPWVAGWRKKHGKKQVIWEPPTEEELEITLQGPGEDLR